MLVRPKKILIYKTPNGSDPYRDWYTEIKDKKAQVTISNRITRLEVGNFGDFRSLGSDLHELRIHRSPGYRVYFGVFQNETVILLHGGTKRTQQRDIDKARNYWNEFLESTQE